MAVIGVIGGSGLYEIEGLQNIEYKGVDTPWGKPSDSFVVGILNNTKMVFLPRNIHSRAILTTPSIIQII